MKLILQKDVKNLGKAGDQVFVKKGYARNFLIPQGQALPLNKERLKAWKHQKVIIEAKKRKAVAERKALIEKLSSIKLKFEKESLKSGKLFGSVTAHEISQALESIHKISVDKRDISFTTLKTVGDHKVTISLDSEQKTDIIVSIKGKITKKQEESGSSKKEQTELSKASSGKEKSEKSSEEKPEKKAEAKSPEAETEAKKPEEKVTEKELKEKSTGEKTTSSEKPDAN